MNGWRHTLITAVLAAAVGAIAAWAAMSWSAKSAQAPDLHQVLHEQIELAPAQEARLRQIETGFASRRAPLEAEVRAANAELSAAIACNRGDTPEVRQAVAHFHAAMGDLQIATISHVFEMRAVLTPEQAKTFDRAVVQTLRADTD